MKGILQSLTNRAALMTAILAILAHFDVNLSETDLEKWLQVTLTLAGLFVTIYGRWRAGGISGLWRKSPPRFL
jgi:hypothetical protein